ncbi:DUF308 domain-containing protein [Vagococcus sp. BWB3-3]|uniref:DUF308 domain-containing protein n=1 Tax=Vagococcus allomyrinae TaxID=2794353 RepID=A0A940PDX3_9ENTE|nr:DUF308 domain-containing protein [Vagococcus allomyrinae]MBP1044251.1 DUF308 domain-containing protein [Vagococcus allomyrinae]
MKRERIKFLVQGFILLILGVLFMIDPIQKGRMFLQVIGISFLIIGTLIVINGLFRTSGVGYTILRVLEGGLVGGVGLVFFLRNPASGAVIVIYSIVWLMIIMAILNTIAVFQTKSNLKWLPILLNGLVIWFGVQSLFDPILAVTIFYWTVAFQLIFMGINHIMISFILPKED